MTYGTAEGLFSAVGAHVCGEVGCLSEGLSTGIAAIRFLPAVSPHVSLEGGGTSIALATDLTDVVASLSRLASRLDDGRTVRHSIDLSGLRVARSQLVHDGGGQHSQVHRLHVGRVLPSIVAAARTGRPRLKPPRSKCLSWPIAVLPQSRHQVSRGGFFGVGVHAGEGAG